MEALANYFGQSKGLLSHVQKGSSLNVCFLLTITENFTDNFIFYLFAILFRFVGIILFTGDFGDNFINDNYHSFPKWLHNLTMHHLVQKLKINISTYNIICIILFILFLFRLFSYLQICRNVKKIINGIDATIPCKYQLYLDELAFLFFPYIIQYLSFIFYIFFITDDGNNNKVIIIKNEKRNYLEIIILVFNGLLIIGHNFLNIVFTFCCNKVYLSSIYDAYSRVSNLKVNEIKRYIQFNYGNFELCFIFILQNLILFEPISLYMNNKTIGQFNKIISVFIALFLTILLLTKINKYIYNNFLNLLISTLAIYCLISIILDLFLYYMKYSKVTWISCVFYNIAKLLISLLFYYFLFLSININLLKNKARSIIFQENHYNKEQNSELFSALLYIHELMIKINEDCDENAGLILTNILNSHIHKCQKMKCRCKLIELFPLNKKLLSDKSKIREHINDFINRLTFLLETAFIEVYTPDNFELSIVLAEHYCHLKENPTMSHSVMLSILTKMKKKLKIFQLVTILTLKEKYINYIAALTRRNFERDLHNHKRDWLDIVKNENYYKELFKSFLLSMKLKKILREYIDNEVKIIKNKSIFEESLTFKYDENNEKIISIVTTYFNSRRIYDENRYDKEENNDSKICCSSQLNFGWIIYLLTKENNYYNTIISLLLSMEVYKNMPVNFIFKIILFFDIFEGNKLPQDVMTKLYESFTTNKNLFHRNISEEAYKILIEKVVEQNENTGCKDYSMFQYKKELRTVYLSEAGAMKIGYKQKEIIKKNVDMLMPKEFCKSHQNLVKRQFIYQQTRYISPRESFLYDRDNINMFPISVNGAMIYDLTNYLIIFLDTGVIFKDNEYHLMINSNFELVAHTKNFEGDYSINKYMFNHFKININYLLGIKVDHLYKQYRKEMSNLHYQKALLDGRTEEYFTRQFFLGGQNSSAFRGFNSGQEKFRIFNDLEVDDNLWSQNEFASGEDNEKLVKLKKSQMKLDLIINNKIEEKVHYKKIFSTINKKKFIGNLSKELSKISESELNNEGNKKFIESVINIRGKINQFLLNPNLLGQYFNIEIQLNYYYDKPFYFIKIIELCRSIAEPMNKNISEPDSPSSVALYNAKHGKKISVVIEKEGSPKNNNDNDNNNDFNSNNIINTNTNKNNNSQFPLGKNQNKVIEKNLLSSENDIININNINNNNKNNKNTNYHNEGSIDENNSGIHLLIKKFEKKNILKDSINEKLNELIEIKNKIDKEKFIALIQTIVILLSLAVLIILIIIMQFQSRITDSSHKMFLIFYYNYYSRDIMINIYSLLLSTFGLVTNITSTSNKLYNVSDNLKILEDMSILLRESYHNFTQAYYEYNLIYNEKLDNLYQERSLYKIRNYWNETLYKTDYSKELESVIFYIRNFLNNNFYSNDSIADYTNFFGRKGIIEHKEKVKTGYIKLLYYFCKNYNIIWENIFNEIQNSSNEGFNRFTNSTKQNFLLLEIFSCLFYCFLFLFIIIYLYYSNLVLYKNILFLFVDMTQDKANYQWGKIKDSKKIVNKILNYKILINDLNVEQLKKFLSSVGNEKYKGIPGFSENDDQTISRRSSFLPAANESGNIPPYQKGKSPRKSLNHNDDNQNNRTIVINRQSKKKDNKKKFGNSGIGLEKSGSGIMFNNDINKGKNKSNYFSNLNNLNLNNSKTPNEKVENQAYDDMQSLIMNKTNISYITQIKFFIGFVIFFSIIYIGYSIFKAIYIMNFYGRIINTYSDFSIFAYRYSILFYYFNTIRTLFVHKNDELEKMMEEMDNVFYKHDESYVNLVNSRLSIYSHTYHLRNTFITSGDESMILLKKEICNENIEVCLKFFEWNPNFFEPGLDFVFKSSLTHIRNIFLDYKRNIENITSMEFVKKQFIDNTFMITDLSLGYVFLYAKKKIFETFLYDESETIDTLYDNVILFDSIPIVASAIAYAFIIFVMFSSISFLTEPVKKSTLRVNNSFVYIKYFKGEKLIIQ